MSSNIEGHAIVTGAGRGIGAAIASSLAMRGCAVTLVGRTIKELEQISSLIQGTCGARTYIAQIDVTNEKEIKSGFKDAIAKLGVPTILVNNAGAAQSSSIRSMPTSVWDQMISVNLTAVFFCIREIIPHMQTAKFGRIVNISSTAGVRGYKYVCAYSAAKHGVIGLTKSLALELESSGITVNAVCPGFADTPLFQKSIDEVVQKTNRPREEITVTGQAAVVEGD
jgi:NAD(P)-dependent dehydrogenase (short-subunit alcohol dehydrogenase family)